MTDPIRGFFGRPFPEAIAALRLRLGDLVPTQRWDDIERAAHDRAFIVAGATKADLLADFAAAIGRARSQGTGLAEFERDFRAIVARHGWTGWTGEGTPEGEAWRMRTIYRTNMATTYAAGRMAQLVEGNFKYWVYRHGGSREPRFQHVAWDGLILPPDHPFWAKAAPPNGWGCSCYITGARSRAGAQRVGGNPDVTLEPGWDKTDPRTGTPPGIGKGWDYAPGASVARTVVAIAQKVAKLPSPTGAELLADWPDRFYDAWSEEFGQFVDTALSGRGRGRVMIVGALKPEWVAAARARGIQPATAEIAVTDQKIIHTFRDNKRNQLARDWYATLPRQLRRPSMVLLDETQSGRPAFLMIFDLPGQNAKLVVRLNYRLKRVGVINTVETGRVISQRDIRTMLSQGMQIVDGSV